MDPGGGTAIVVSGRAVVPFGPPPDVVAQRFVVRGMPTDSRRVGGWVRFSAAATRAGKRGLRIPKIYRNCISVNNCYQGATMPKKTVRRVEPVSRRDVAEMLNLHVDSVSRCLHEGLSSAVVVWGGSGREMQFDKALVQRWEFARTCRRDSGGPCAQCRRVLEDCKCAGDHLLDARHGIHESCNPDTCGQWRFCLPCRLGPPS